MSAKKFILERICPDGRTRRHDPTSRRTAAIAAYYVLLDNRATDRKSAASLSYELENSPIGTEVSGYGYVFRLVEA